MGGDCLKRRGLRQFSDLREGEGLDKKEGSRIFEEGGGDTPVHTMYKANSHEHDYSVYCTIFCHLLP